ncbi:uncharacterized protein LOC143252037 [Tachypleus tridentatus]|uniref:uncharacterized protein LOC143252037 n=1 Tax=Tachypleus tridentatus TaxID=6853 RepID=UPI003FD0BE59
MVIPEGMAIQVLVFLYLCGLQFGASSHYREQEPLYLNISNILLQNTSPAPFSTILFYKKFFGNLQAGPKVNISEPCARASHLLALATHREESWALRKKERCILFKEPYLKKISVGK